MLRKIKFVAAIVALMVLIVLCQAGGGLLKKGFMKGRESSETATSAGRGRLIVLDPGHGGIDGGKKGIKRDQFADFIDYKRIAGKGKRGGCYDALGREPYRRGSGE